MERRKSKRIDVDLPVHFSINQQARIINLSMSGLKLEAKKLLTKGMILFLIINLPGEDLKVIGEVRWSKSEAQGKFENGVEFFFMDNTYKKKIKEYIENQEKQYHCTIAEQN